MTLPAKKAAEQVAKKVIPAASKAVSASEAHTIAPSKTSSLESHMPWEGWFSSFVRDKIGSNTYDKIKKVILFAPDDIHGLEQAPRQVTKVPLTDDGSKTAQFRYPAPGSQPKARIPSLDKGEDPFDIAYYPRDTARRHRDPAFPNPALEEIKLALLPQDASEVKDEVEKFNEGAKSSPGNKGRFATGPSDFDPSGLRATMSANHEALNASLDANEPDHLPMPTWWNNQEEAVAWYKERNLPVPMGQTGFATVPREGRIARW